MDRRKAVTRSNRDMRAPGGIAFWACICVTLYVIGWALVNLP